MVPAACSCALPAGEGGVRRPMGAPCQPPSPAAFPRGVRRYCFSPVMKPFSAVDCMSPAITVLP